MCSITCIVGRDSQTILYYTGAVSKAMAVSNKNPFFPETTFITYDQHNTQQIFGKIHEFNESAEKRGVQVFSSEQLSFVETLVKSDRCSSTAKALDTLWQLLQWPAALLFPVLDVLRLAVLRLAANEHFTSHDGFLDCLRSQLSCRTQAKNQLLALRVLCNLCVLEPGERWVVRHADTLLKTALSALQDSTEKPMQVALSTFVLNVTIGCQHAAVAAASSSGSDSSAAAAAAVRRCMQAAAQLTETQSDTEAHFRLLVAVGTALTPPPSTATAPPSAAAASEAMSAAQSLDLENFLHWTSVDGAEKTRQCARLVAELLHRPTADDQQKTPS